MSRGLIVAAAFATAACGSNSGEVAPPDVQALTAEDVYERVAQAVNRTSEVYYAKVDVRVDGGAYFSYQGVQQRWVYGLGGLARETWRADSAGDGAISREDKITVGDEEYEISELDEQVVKSPATQCRGITAAVSTMLACPFRPADDDTDVEGAVFDGKRAIVLVRNAESEGNDESFVYNFRLYLDASTYLPLVLEMDGVANDAQPLNGRWLYENKFVPLDSLTKDHFDPGTIGYVDTPQSPEPTPGRVPGT